MKRILAASSILLASACSGGGGSGGAISAATTETAVPVPAGMHRLTLHTAGRAAFLSVPEGLHCPGACFADFRAGEEVRVDLSLAQGQCAQSIDSDPVGCLNASNCSVVMDQDREITWRTQDCVGFGEPGSDAGNSVAEDAGPPAVGKHRLSVAVSGPFDGVLFSSPGGIACPGQCAADYDDDTVVRLDLRFLDQGDGACIPPDGVQGCQNASNCTVKMDADHDVSWTFTYCPF
ncbi:MAG TPA: hypothetical protein VGH20_19975 [Myxococcales bacterium]|jgi:hypothetical protein